MESNSPDDIKEMNAAMCVAKTQSPITSTSFIAEVNPSLVAVNVEGQADLTDWDHHHVILVLTWTTPTPFGHTFLKLEACFKRESQAAPEHQIGEHEDQQAY